MTDAAVMEPPRDAKSLYVEYLTQNPSHKVYGYHGDDIANFWVVEVKYMWFDSTGRLQNIMTSHVHPHSEAELFQIQVEIRAIMQRYDDYGTD